MNIADAETAVHDLLTQLRLDVNEGHVGTVLSWLGNLVGLEGQPATAPAEAEGPGASDNPAPPAQPDPTQPPPAA